MLCFAQYYLPNVIQRSSIEDLVNAKELVGEFQRFVRWLLKRKRKVHVIWDFDFVLGSGRSQDVVDLFGLPASFEYENRLLLQCPEVGLWLNSATRCPEMAYPGFYSQDIVTTRSSFLAFRVMFFCLNWGIPLRWQLFPGHQAKKGSYGIILKSLDSDTHVFMVDDSAENCRQFDEIARESGFRFAESVLVPRIRMYSEEELREHVGEVLGAEDDCVLVSHDRKEAFMVMPDSIESFRRFLSDVRYELKRKVMPQGDIKTFKTAIVAELLPLLEDFRQEAAPQMEATADNLYTLFEILREPNAFTEAIEAEMNRVSDAGP